MNLQQLVAAELPPQRYIVKDLLTPGCAVLAAKPKVGKSGFVLRLCIEVAAGRPFLGRFETAGTEVLYIPYEDEVNDIQDRANAQLRSLGLRAPARLEIQPGWPKGQEGGYKRLEDVIEDYGHDLGLVVIDDLRHFDPLVRSYNRDNQLIERIDRIGLEHDVCILVVQHQTKGRVANSRNWNWLDRIQGSGTGAARIIIGLEREDNATEGVVRVIGKGVPEAALALSWHGASGLWAVMATESSASLTELQRDTVAIVKRWPGRKAHELARLADRDFEALRQMLRLLASGGHVNAVERRYYVTERVQPWATDAHQVDLGDLVAIDGRVVRASVPAEGWPGDEVPLMPLHESGERWLRERGGVA